MHLHDHYENGPVFLSKIFYELIPSSKFHFDPKIMFRVSDTSIGLRVFDRIIQIHEYKEHQLWEAPLSGEIDIPNYTLIHEVEISDFLREKGIDAEKTTEALLFPNQTFREHQALVSYIISQTAGIFV